MKNIFYLNSIGAVLLYASLWMENQTAGKDSTLYRKIKHIGCGSLFISIACMCLLFLLELFI